MFQITKFQAHLGLLNKTVALSTHIQHLLSSTCTSKSQDSTAREIYTTSNFPAGPYHHASSIQDSTAREIHSTSNFPAGPYHHAASSIPLTTGRPRLVILGTGWGGARVARDIDPKKFDITVISPRNHMVFTPLLASTCVGTLETRSVTVPIIDIQRALRQPQNYFYAAEAHAIHADQKVIEVVSSDGVKFSVEYDALVIATGSQGSTFGIKGVEEHTHFLRTAADSQAIRATLLRNWNLANTPGRSMADRERLLHVVMVGGGPTGVEAAAELADFINRDLFRIDADRARDMRITLIEASELLGSFDARLREYAAKKLVKAGVHLMKGIVKEVRENELELMNGEVIPFGLCIWSTGVGPSAFTISLPFSKTAKGRIAVDEYLRVLAPLDPTNKDGDSSSSRIKQAAETAANEPKKLQDVSMAQDEEPITSQPRILQPVPFVYSLGDCCANEERPLPALAQVAEQQGRYLAKVLNEIHPDLHHPGSSNNHSNTAGGSSRLDDHDAGSRETKRIEPFVYKYLGSMATVSGRAAIIQLPNRDQSGSVSWAGFISWLGWRSAYLTRLGTFKARMYVAMNWSLSLLFGRDISQW